MQVEHSSNFNRILMTDQKNEKRPTIVGRGSSLPVHNRFERIERQSDYEQLDDEDQLSILSQKLKTEYFTDRSKSIVSRNDSPDIDFNYSINPYRGCAHGCSYCYARPSHEFLGFNAGIDFETKIMVKPDAAELFRKWLSRPSWIPEPIMLSGVTDCYQGCEKEFGLTRQCLEIALEMRQPIRLITKNSLIRRDKDLLEKLASLRLVCVTISVTSLDKSLTRVMEPRTSSPQSRLDTIAELTQIGVPVKVLTAPIIPGLNDSEIPMLLESVADAGATHAGYVMLRLPQTVAPVFLDWLERSFPERVDKILNRVRSMRGDKLNSNEFGDRFRGRGIWAEQIRALFETSRKRFGLNQRLPEIRCDLFRKVDEHQRHQQDLF